MDKKLILIIIVSLLMISILITGIFFAVRTIKMNEYKNMDITLPDAFTITAHTGCMDTEENTLDSIKIGVENGASIVEFDLYFTKDGEPVLAHDEPVGGEVTLDEAFEYISKIDNIKVNVDVKTCDALDKVYPLAEKHGIEDRIFYTGINEEDVEIVKKDSPQVEYYLNVDVKASKADEKDYILTLVEKVKNAGAVGINFNYKSATKELVDIFHENGLLVSIWTVNDEYNMYKILSFAPDNITTRNPDELSRIVNEIK